MHTNGDDGTSTISYLHFEFPARPKLADHSEIKGTRAHVHVRGPNLSNVCAHTDAQNVPYLNVTGANPFV